MDQERYSAHRLKNIIQEWMFSDKTERLGQYAYNHLDTTGRPRPRLFYTEDTKEATALIYRYYLDRENAQRNPVTGEII